MLTNVYSKNLCAVRQVCYATCLIRTKPALNVRKRCRHPPTTSAHNVSVPNIRNNQRRIHKLLPGSTTRRGRSGMENAICSEESTILVHFHCHLEDMKRHKSQNETKHTQNHPRQSVKKSNSNKNELFSFDRLWLQAT